MSTDDYFQIEVRDTGVSVMRGAWMPQFGRHPTLAIALVVAKRMTESCACGERLVPAPQDVRVVEWRRGDNHAIEGES